MIHMTKIFVSTGILVCLAGLLLIALSGKSAFSEGYGSGLAPLVFSLSSDGQVGQCIAVKGSQTCRDVEVAFN
nr:hypothetical protein [uncultured Cohaesibacter sp.]